VHRDIKTLNILISADNQLKICDLGGSRLLTSGALFGGKVGTPLYLAPEVLQQHPYTLCFLLSFLDCSFIKIPFFCFFSLSGMITRRMFGHSAASFTLWRQDCPLSSAKTLPICLPTFCIRNPDPSHLFSALSSPLSLAQC
jgi:serine/threonine protein kinase